MTTNGYAPCPGCGADNMEHRRECWRCKKPLPANFHLNARHKLQREARKVSALGALRMALTRWA